MGRKVGSTGHRGRRAEKTCSRLKGKKETVKLGSSYIGKVEWSSCFCWLICEFQHEVSRFMEREAFDCGHIKTKEHDQENEVGRWSLRREILYY